MKTINSQFLHCNALDTSREHKFVYATDIGRAPEVAGERAEKRDPEALMAFSDKLSWTSQVENLTRAALGETYKKMNLYPIIKAIDERAIRDKLDDVKFIQIKEGEIRFLDGKQRPIQKFYLAEAFREVMADYVGKRRTEIAWDTRRETRYYFANDIPWGGGIDGSSNRTTTPRRPLPQVAPNSHASNAPRTRSLDASISSPMAQPRLTDTERKALLENPRTPADPEQEKAVLELMKLYDEGKTSRQGMLRTLELTSDPKYDIIVRDIDVCIRDANAKDFEKKWVSMRHSDEITALMTEPANTAEGYAYNPFVELKGNHREILRELIQKGYNDRLYLREVYDLIYSDRFDDVKKTLKNMKVSDEVIGLLTKGDLITSYRELSNIAHTIESMVPNSVPEDMRKWVPYLSQIKTTLVLLGDYTAYGTRLIQLMQLFRFDPLKATEDRRRTMHEHTAERTPESQERNKVIDGLEAVFGNIENPREYPSGSFAELRYLFTRQGDLRELTFQDMNGTVRSIPPMSESEWATLYQSGETAYKLAFEAAAVPLSDPKQGIDTYKEWISEEKAAMYLNEALQLGITAYPALPASKKISLKMVIDRLSAAGAEVSPGVKLEFTGNLRNDAINLAQALEVKDMSELQNHGGNTLQQLIACERIKFIRIGSVIKQKARAQEYIGETDSLAKGRTLNVKFQAEHAEAITAQLEVTGRFTKAQLEKIKDMLIGGGLAVIPSADLANPTQAAGGGVNINIPFNNGVTLGITATLLNSSGTNILGAGLSIGKHFEVSDKVTVDISVGGGASLTPVGAGFVGAGASVTRKFDSVDFSIQGGAGVALAGPTAIMPTGMLGIGLNWGKYQERYASNLNREMTRMHFDQLKDDTAYEQVTDHPELYPEFADLIYKLNNTGIKLTEVSRREFFMSMFSVMKEGIQNSTLTESIHLGRPSGLGLGVAMAGPVPVPYLYLTFPLWKRTLVYRVATNDQKVRAISEDIAQNAMFADIARIGLEKPTAAIKMLESQSQIVLDRDDGRPRLLTTKNEKMDFSYLDSNPNQFEKYRMALAERADIIVKPVEDNGQGIGLMELDILQANGNSYVYVDPELANDVFVVSHEGRLFMSVKKGRQIYFKRQDITYPFQNDGAVEKTIITITGNKSRKNETIRRRSGSYLMRQPTTAWGIREGDITFTSKQKAEHSQLSFKTWEEYRKWWTANADEHTDRVQMEPFASLRQSYEQAYDRLLEKVLVRESGASAMTIREGLEKLIKERLLNKDGQLIDDVSSFYKINSTSRFDLPTEKKEGKKSKGKKAKKGAKEKVELEWSENFGKIVKGIQEKFKDLDPPLNEMEINAVVMDLLIGSFAKRPEKFQEWLQNKKGPMHKILFSIFSDYYDGMGLKEKEKETKADQAAEYVLEQMKAVDIDKPGTPIPEGYLFTSVVGTTDVPRQKGGTPITGLRRILNFHETSTEFGSLGTRDLNLRDTNETGKQVADMWLQKLSPYKVGVHKVAFPNRDLDATKYDEYRTKVIENLHSPMALKLTRIVAPLVLTPAEMIILSDFYGAGNEPDITPETDVVLKKFLDGCDKVRTAELAGQKEVNLNNFFKVVITKFSLQMGLFKKCGNVSAWMQEEFVPWHLGESSPRQIAVGSSDTIVDIRQFMTARVFSIGLGAAVPIPYAIGVGQAPPPVPENPRPGIKIPPPPPGKLPEVPPTVGKIPPPRVEKNPPGKPNPTEGDKGNI